MSCRNNLRGQFLPATADPDHHSVRPQNATEAELGIRVTDPVLAALVPPGLCNELDLDVHG